MTQAPQNYPIPENITDKDIELAGKFLETQWYLEGHKIDTNWEQTIDFIRACTVENLERSIERLSYMQMSDGIITKEGPGEKAQDVSEDISLAKHLDVPEIGDIEAKFRKILKEKYKLQLQYFRSRVQQYLDDANVTEFRVEQAQRHLAALSEEYEQALKYKFRFEEINRSVIWRYNTQIIVTNQDLIMGRR